MDEETRNVLVACFQGMFPQGGQAPFWRRNRIEATSSRSSIPVTVVITFRAIKFMHFLRMFGILNVRTSRSTTGTAFGICAKLGANGSTHGTRNLACERIRL